MYVRMKEERVAITQNDENRIFSPVGLDIGATNPEEIALSICAEIKAHFAIRDGGHLRLREKPIYEV